MAANPTPTNNRKLLSTCHDLLKGCQALETELGLKQNTAAVMQAAWEAVGDGLALVGLRTKERGTARKALLQADAEGERVISRCRLRLATIFGSRINVQWEAAGFPDRSTMVPEMQDKRLTLLASLAAWFTAQPAHGSADMGATAATCHTAHEALSDARSAENESHARLALAVKEKNRLLRALRGQMRSLIRELNVLMESDDPRWRRFGLNIPARLSAPRPVKKVTLTAHGNGVVYLQWSAARHAKRYRVQVKTGEAAAFSPAATVHETSTLLRGLTPGQTIAVRVIAANAVDEAAPSPETVIEQVTT